MGWGRKPLNQPEGGKGPFRALQGHYRGKEAAEVIGKAVVIFVGVLIGELIGRWIDRRSK